MIVHIDPKSPTPPYEQLRKHIVEAVQSGAIPAGTRLPPVRKLANELGLAANTVARTFRELEQNGIVETRGRHGTFVLAEDAQAQQVIEAAKKFVEAVSKLNISQEEAVKAVRQVWA